MKIFLISMSFLLSFLSGPTRAEIVEGQEYQLIRGIPDEKSDGVVQVYEFFNYACGHCYEFQPVIKSWADKPPKGVKFNYMPAIFNERMVPLAKLYFTIEEMGLLGSLHQKVYDAIHRDGVTFPSDESILAWVAKSGVDAKKFEKTYSSFGVGNRARMAMQLTRKYRIPGTPYVTVGGKYLTGPSMTLRADRSGIDSVKFIATLNMLVEMSGK